MDRLAKLDRDELIARMRAEFERTMSQVARAVNDAPDGRLIDGSEKQVRDVLGEFRRRAFETATQMRVEATEASPDFSPGEGRAGASRGGGALDAQLQRPGGTASPPLPQRRRRQQGEQPTRRWMN